MQILLHVAAGDFGREGGLLDRFAAVGAVIRRLVDISVARGATNSGPRVGQRPLITVPMTFAVAGLRTSNPLRF